MATINKGLVNLEVKHIAAEVLAGHITDVAAEAIWLARQTGVEVRFTFNNVRFRVNASSSVATITNAQVRAKTGTTIGPDGKVMQKKS